MANPAKAAQRVSALSRAGIHNKATELLWHDLALFEKATGKELGGRTGLLPPKDLTNYERAVYDSIIDTFLEDPTSTVKGVREQFKDIQELRKNAEIARLEKLLGNSSTNIDKIMEKWKLDEKERIKKMGMGDIAEAVDRYERMQKEYAIKEAIGSDQYKYMWSVAQQNNIKTSDMIQALYDVTVGNNDDLMGVSMLLGEGEFIPSEVPDDYVSAGQLEEVVLQHLKNVMEVDR